MADYDEVRHRWHEIVPLPDALDNLLASTDFGVLIESARPLNDRQLRFLLVQAVTRLRRLTTTDEEHRAWLNP